MRTFAALALASVVAAQTVTVVQVGGTSASSGGPLQFIPSNVTAKVGDIISFQFTGAPGNHTVTQSSFASPCQPLSGGFDSGFIYVPNGTAAANAPSWNLTITDVSKPLWYYCQQLKAAPHCVNGMVGAINAPTSNNTFAAFQTAAKASTGSPGQANGALAGVGASASAAPGPLTGSITGYALPTSTSPGGNATSATSTSATHSATSSSSAASLTASTFVVILAAMFGITLA